MAIRSLLALALPLALAPVAPASVPVATGAASPTLEVDAAGNAAVGWTSGGARRRMIVRPSGELVRSAALAGPDVSKPVRGDHVPWQRALRVVPSGWYYALQQRGDELRFARWHGVPTEISLEATLLDAGGVRVSGFATIDERRLAPAVARRARVTLEAKEGDGWKRVGPLPLNARAAFAKVVAGRETRTYRVVIDGPGTAPDAVAVATAQVLDPVR